MIEKIFFLLDLIDNLHELQPHLDKILKLANKDFSGLDLEKLASNVNIYSMRLNKADRLLYTLLDDKILILELILNHDYQKSRFLNHSPLLKKLLQHQSIAKDLVLELNFSQVDAPSLISASAPVKNIELVPMMKHDKKIIEFNPTQHQAMMTDSAVVVTGGAGSGKTCVAESKIKCFFSKIRLQQLPSDSVLLFTTESKGLLNYQYHQFKQEPHFSELLDKHSKFLDFNNILKTTLAERRLSAIDSEFEFFRTWFEKRYQQSPYQTDFVWRELGMPVAMTKFTTSKPLVIKTPKSLIKI